MTIKISLRNGDVIELETNDRIGGRKAGDLIEEQFPPGSKPTKAIVVGVDHKEGGRIWTVERTRGGFFPAYWESSSVQEYTKLIKRPHSPDLTVESLEKSLRKFVNENRVGQ